jgi:hypothetical protein
LLLTVITATTTQADLALCELEDNELLASAEDSDDGESDSDSQDGDQQNNGDADDANSSSESQRQQQQQQSQQQSQQQQLQPFEDVEQTPAQAAAEAAAKERCAMMEGLVQLLELAIVQAREVLLNTTAHYYHCCCYCLLCY